MYQNEYYFYVVCRASQVVTLNHEEKTLGYHDIDEVYENEHLQIYDVTNKYSVGHIDWQSDDEGMYELAYEMITEYEEKLSTRV